MKSIALLDCTLRDGGYVNNWLFGKKSIENIVRLLEKSNIEIIELGFLRNEEQNPDRTIFSSIENINLLIGNKNPNIIYSAMIEAFNPFDLTKLSNHIDTGVDLIRVCIWKRCLKEHIEYCKRIREKGYQITIQPSRVEQYSDDEFIKMIVEVNKLDPYALYIVDTWGTQSSNQILHYLELANKYLNHNIRIGYHGHNNKLQAQACAEACLRKDFNRGFCLDSSIMGMGRGAGNLNTEVIMDYLNQHYKKNYSIQNIVDAFTNNLLTVYKEKKWGYSMYSYLCSMNNCNPNYASYFVEKDYSIDTFLNLLASLSENEKIVFSESIVDKKLSKLK